jgi:plastocyanin
MIDAFDSRAMRRTDCYGQRFMRTGEYRYDIVPSSWGSVTTDGPYAIEVGGSKASNGPMHQHNVVVETDGKKFRPDLEVVKIEEGDLVLWNCPHASSPFAVVGDEDFFGSSRLVNECGYSHAFASAGRYRWMDANGSGIGGSVLVADPPGGTAEDFRRWKQSLTKGTLVMIADGRADPADIEITTGQTVYFAVVTGPGITITDIRLLPGARDDLTQAR